MIGKYLILSGGIHVQFDTRLMLNRVNMYASTWLLTKTADVYKSNKWPSRVGRTPTMEDIEI